MARVEKLAYHKHVINIEEKSVLVPGEILEEQRLMCPRCKTLLWPLGHLEEKECVCGLHMRRTGNELHIWED